MPAIVYIKPLPGREADWGLANDSSYRRSWWVMTDSRYMFEGQLLADGITAGYFPAPYVDTHPNDARFLCKRLTGKQDRNAALHWVVDAIYDTKPGQDDDKETPLDRRAKIRWRTNKYQKAVEKDRDDEAILNSAGYYFDPPPLKDLSRWTVTVSKNVPAVPTDILTYPDALNAATWTIQGIAVEPNAAKIMEIDISDLQKEQDEEFYVFTYTVEFDRDLWQGIYLNIGFYDADGERIKDASDKPVVYPWPLDEDGMKIATPTPANATYSRYDIFPELDFSILPVE